MLFTRSIQRIPAVPIVCVLPLAILWMSGCQSPTVTHEQAQSVLETRIGIRQQLGITKTQLDLAVAALNDINGKQSDDLVAAFNKYGAQVDLLDGSVAQLETASAASKAQADAYFETSQTKIALINDPDLKARATIRRQKALGLAQTIDDDTRNLDSAYRGFIQHLRDIQSYLAADLTSGSVRSIQDHFDKSNQEVAPLKAKSDQLSWDMEIANELMNTGEVKPATSTTTAPATDSSPTPTSVPATKPDAPAQIKKISRRAAEPRRKREELAILHSLRLSVST
jgi:hypothetical protein